MIFKVFFTGKSGWGYDIVESDTKEEAKELANLKRGERIVFVAEDVGELDDYVEPEGHADSFDKPATEITPWDVYSPSELL